MTKPKAETTEEPTPDETPEPIEGPDDGEEEAQEEEEQTSEEAAAEDGGAEFARRLEDAFEDHARKLRAIFGDSLHLWLCPTCDGYGTIDPNVGAPGLFKEDPTKQACEACGGMGQVISHSRAPGHELVTCTTCAGQGWQTVSLPAQQTNVAYMPQAVTTPAPPAQQYGYMGSDGVFVPFVNTNPATGV